MCDKGITNGMEMDTGLTITDVKADWQKLSRKVLPAKRTRSPESPKSQRFPKEINASKKIESSSDANLSSSEPEENAAPKPPPIIIPGVTNIGKMLKDLDEVGSFFYKATKGGNVRIMPKARTTYRKIVSHLDNLHLAFSTYQPKEERPFRIVIKGLHFSTPTSYIIDAFDKLGHKARDIKSAVSKQARAQCRCFL